MTGPAKIGTGQLNERQKPMARPKLKKSMQTANRVGLGARAKAAKSMMKEGY